MNYIQLKKVNVVFSMIIFFRLSKLKSKHLDIVIKMKRNSFVISFGISREFPGKNLTVLGFSVPRLYISGTDFPFPVMYIFGVCYRFQFHSRERKPF